MTTIYDNNLKYLKDDYDPEDDIEWILSYIEYENSRDDCPSFEQ
jgi:hypothetical protein